jgi:WD40 repeat protein
VSVSPDGKQVVSGSSDRTLRVWDMSTGQCASVLGGHASVVTSVSVNPDGKQVVSGSKDKI